MATDAPAHNCYVVFNETGLTYVGYTVNQERRLRQHCGELSGGARYTSGRGPWHYLLFIESPDLTKHLALSLEWWMKHPTGHRKCPKEFCGKLGRLKAMAHVLQKSKFETVGHFTVAVHADYAEAAQTLCAEAPRVSIVAM